MKKKVFKRFLKKSNLLKFELFKKYTFFYLEFNNNIIFFYFNGYYRLKTIIYYLLPVNR